MSSEFCESDEFQKGCKEGGPRTTRTNLADMGGQYRPASGDTTRPTDACLQWFNEELQRAIDNVDWSQPF